MSSTEINVQRQYLKAYVDSIMALTKEARMCATEDGLRFLGVDRSHVAMVSSTLEAKACESYEVKRDVMVRQLPCIPLDDHFAALLSYLEEALGIPNVLQEEEEGAPEYAVDLDKFKKAFLKGGSPTDTLRLTFDERNLTVSYPITKQGDRATMTMGLLKKESMSTPKYPKFDLLGSFMVQTEIWFAAVDAAKGISDHVCLTQEGGNVTLSAQASDESDHLNIAIGYAYQGPRERLECRFPVDYLMSMAKAFKGYKSVNVQFDTDKPCRFTAKTLTQQGAPAVTVEYLLAPRISND